MAVGEREVSWVVRHGVTLGLDAEAHIRQREVGIGGLGDGNALYRVAFMLVDGRIECIVQLHIRIQRVILRTCLLLGNRVVQRSRHLHLVREELTQLDIGGQRIGLVVFLRTGSHAILQASESLRHNLTRQVDGSHVRELHVQCSRCCPATCADHVHQAQLVHPYLARLDGS